MHVMSNPNPAPSARPDFPKMEEEILSFWEKNDIFARSISEKSEKKRFVFYDGPPFATGLPHPGHLLQSALKDAVPRYKTMNGYRVDRVWGWDCHGLPVENLIEKKLLLGGRSALLEYGIDKFNNACRASVMEYEQEWKRYIRRLGRWVDMDHPYKTMDDGYIESVWWVFAQMFNKKLIYQDFRVSLYCPRCATPLSNNEVTANHAYRDVEDPAVTVKFKVKDQDKTYLLAWTTTPWTLPANTAIAVHPDLYYIQVYIPQLDEHLILAEARKDEVLKDYVLMNDEGEGVGKGDIVSERRMMGTELVGMEYEPLYQFAAVPEGKVAYRVVDMPYVSAADGTGLVHTAPAFGEDDFNAAKIHNLALLLTVDQDGRLNSDMGPFSGLFIKKANPLVLEDLEKRNLLFANETIVHTVPECWRCSTLLMFRAQTAWFVNVQMLKKKMIEANKKIHWMPEHIKDGRFGKGLDMAPDWCISRTRYWGAPMPVWECDKCREHAVAGSVQELKDLAGGKLPKDWDIHRPGIDNVQWPCTCGGAMTRVPDVFDCWFESGSMPYASVHYPFENKDVFDDNYPADFIGEGQDQTRGWFYTMHVIAAALFGKPAAKNIVVTGMIQTSEGKKMSKSLRNYTDPYEIMDRIGADALRLYLLSSPVVQAESINFSDDECAQIQRTIIGTLWNVRQFYLTYAEGKKVEIKKPRSLYVLDRWIFSRLSGLTQHMTERMEAYDLVDALRPVRLFVDDLSTWWLRRSRERMKQEEDQDEVMDALRTLREVLLEFAKLIAPFAPFFAERLYQDLEGEKMSVHLAHWPKADERAIDARLEADMEWVRTAVNQGLEQRVQAKMPVRQALASMDVSFKIEAEFARLSQKKDLLALMRDELNVEQVVMSKADASQKDPWAVSLDLNLTPELKRKGMVRELARHIMQTRKRLGLTPGDHIRVRIGVTDMYLSDQFEALKFAVVQETKADDVLVGLCDPASFEALEPGQLTMDWEGNQVLLEVERT